MSSNKNLLILERSSEILSFQKDSDGSYVLEGIFGEIGVKNKNGRIYDEAEYLPQIQSLQEKIKNSKLMGELDHPQNFDISLKNVSHVIEELRYDKDSQKVRGKIRLLNTTAGREAKALVDDGIPLHISSRAAGVVESNGKVKIKRLFTYDLVADPGFENAQLNRVNESYGFSNTDLIQIYELDNPIPNDKYFNIKENNGSSMEGTVKLDDFNAYSKHLSQEMNAIKEEIESLKNTGNDKTTNNLIAYTNKLASKMNEMFSYMKYVAESLDGVVGHSDYIIENMNNMKSYMDHVAEKADQGIQYTEDVAKKTNDVLEYASYIGENVNNLAEYSDYLGENVNNLAEFGDYLSENLSNVAEYAEYIKENLETVGQYSDYTAENVKAIKKQLNTLNEEDRAKEIEKDGIEMGEPDAHSEEEGEAVVGESLQSYKNEIAQKLDIIIESAQKQAADENGNLHFLKFMNKKRKDEFFALNETVQYQIIDACKNKNYTSSQEVERIWESVISPKDTMPNFIKHMPEEYRSTWNSLSQKRKSQIIAESNFHNLNSQYQINNFWQTRDLRETSIEIERVNESKSINGEVKMEYGVDSKYLDNFAAELNRRFSK